MIQREVRVLDFRVNGPGVARRTQNLSGAPKLRLAWQVSRLPGVYQPLCSRQRLAPLD